MEVGEELWNSVFLSRRIGLWEEAGNVMMRRVESNGRKGRD
jgi:hypothetical protein